MTGLGFYRTEPSTCQEKARRHCENMRIYLKSLVRTNRNYRHKNDVKDLSIFSEMACPGMGFLIKRGIATGRARVSMMDLTGVRY